MSEIQISDCCGKAALPRPVDAAARATIGGNRLHAPKGKQFWFQCSQCREACTVHTLTMEIEKDAK